MTHKRADKELNRRDEQRIIKIATDAIAGDFENPKRFACPVASVLKAIAHRDLSTPDAEDIVDHIATCAPCFEQYSRERHSHLLRLRGGLALACAAVAVAVGIAWQFMSPHRGPGGQPVEEAFGPALSATLDLRNSTTERSGEAGPMPDAEAPHLKRGLLKLTVKLPLGSEDGAYEIQFRTSQDQSAANSTGNAVWDGAAETLIAMIDLRKLAPGQYTLALRASGSSWRTYRIFLE
jgi:hypothetical protein